MEGNGTTSSGEVASKIMINPATGLRWKCGDVNHMTGMIFRSAVKGRPRFASQASFDRSRANGAARSRNKSDELRQSINEAKRARRESDSDYRSKENSQLMNSRKKTPECYEEFKAAEARRRRTKRRDDKAWRDAQNAKRRTPAYRKWQRDYKALKLATNPLYNLASRSRIRIRKVVRERRIPKTGKTVDMLGCTWDVLKAHLESLFLPGMSWDNNTQWHIDHRTPLASAVTPEDLVRLCHYTNLQPLWAADNLRKGSKLPT